MEVYTDISAEWISGDDTLTANWTTTTTGSIITHQVQLATQSLFTEVSDHIQREPLQHYLQVCVLICSRGIRILFHVQCTFPYFHPS